MRLVLIVEDYSSIKNLYADAFNRAGFVVETADSGYEGLEKTHRKEFDIIILDMLMLEYSGTDFLDKFHPKQHPNTNVLVVSNLDSPSIIEKAKQLGAAGYLIKSQYTPDQLVAAVKPWLKHNFEKSV